MMCHYSLPTPNIAGSVQLYERALHPGGVDRACSRITWWRSPGAGHRERLGPQWGRPAEAPTSDGCSPTAAEHQPARRGRRHHTQHPEISWGLPSLHTARFTPDGIPPRLQSVRWIGQRGKASISTDLRDGSATWYVPFCSQVVLTNRWVVCRKMEMDFNLSILVFLRGLQHNFLHRKLFREINQYIWGSRKLWHYTTISNWEFQEENGIQTFIRISRVIAINIGSTSPS